MTDPDNIPHGIEVDTSEPPNPLVLRLRSAVACLWGFVQSRSDGCQSPIADLLEHDSDLREKVFGNLRLLDQAIDDVEIEGDGIC